jgi:hypothetical protein
VYPALVPLGELSSTGSRVGAGGGLCAVTFRGSTAVLLARQYVEMGQRGLRLAEDAECLVQIGEPQQAFLQVGDPNPSVAVGACVSADSRAADSTPV